jgi:hypothetical protein
LVNGEFARALLNHKEMNAVLFDQCSRRHTECADLGRMAGFLGWDHRDDPALGPDRSKVARLKSAARNTPGATSIAALWRKPEKRRGLLDSATSAHLM